MSQNNMQIGLLPGSTSSRPMSDCEKLQVEVKRIMALLTAIEEGRSSMTTETALLESVQVTNELIQLMDNANDFYKIGGFTILSPLLAIPNVELQSAVSELIADLVQNNMFCQNKLLETELMNQLLNLMKQDDVTVCTKSLYALSCLCRNNHEAVIRLEELNALPVLLQVLQRPVEKLRTKAAFLLSYLVANEPAIRDLLYNVGFVQKLAELIKEDWDSSQEHLLRTMLILIENHGQSKEVCKNLTSLKEMLESKLQFYNEKGEFQECKDYSLRILQICFNVGK